MVLLGPPTKGKEREEREEREESEKERERTGDSERDCVKWLVYVHPWIIERGTLAGSVNGYYYCGNRRDKNR